LGNPLRALFARAPSPESAPQEGVHSPTKSHPDEMQSRIRTTWGFPAIFHYVDTHPKDGWPDVVSSPAGGRYMGVQALSLRTPEDASYLLDSHLTPIWLRTTAHKNEMQRTALSPLPPASPYGVEAWHVASYRGIPTVGAGPGTMLVVPLAQQNQD
jgi:hypothetical protein